MFQYSFPFSIGRLAARADRARVALSYALLGCVLAGSASVHIAKGDHLPPVTPVLPGSDHRHENHAGADFQGANLTGVDFSAANLSGANLFNASLDNARFVGAAMQDAILWNATIGGADFSGSDLRNVALRNMRGTSPVFFGADLSGADMDDTALNFADMRGAIFTGADIGEFTSFRTNFRGANLSGALSIDSHVEAVYDSTTLLPPGFDPVGAGWIFVPEPSTNALAIVAAALCLVACTARRRLSSRFPAASGVSCELR